MGIGLIDRGSTCLLAGLLLAGALLGVGSASGQSDPIIGAPGNVAAAMEQYRRALDAYNAAHDKYIAVANAYWSSITEKRKSRNAKRAAGEALALDDYVLDQPPVYTGPPRPRNPLKPEAPGHRVPVPVVADFVAAAQKQFNFVPRMPQSDIAFKQVYAQVAQAAGLTKDQVVRIYSFEATGNGSYDVEAGLEYNKHGRAITTALGYNQLLATNSVEIVAEKGPQFIEEFHTEARGLADRQRQALEYKIEALRKMVAFARSVPDDWNQHEILANTEKGLGVHALNLDIDVGPLLQTQKLLDSVAFARRKGVTRTLTAAELEMMNLTGDGNGFDMVTMPLQWREQVPTSNFFRPSGYFDNPVAQHNNVVAKLIAATDTRMDEETKKQGARDLAAALR
ncbi:MAG TPA: hypothetical protein VK825_20270 [Xanthobacteraceae bacterium]|jgi:hypothetical protein|nr:hypothetical protein [Xanthobacteraceae bacterium]